MVSLRLDAGVMTSSIDKMGIFLRKSNGYFD